MSEKESPKTEERENTGSPADLPEEFWLDLLDLPSCKSRGYCDDCGRCER